MDSNKMVHMVNQIALFFAPYPHEEAVAGVADHVLRFWPPRMKQQLYAYVAAAGDGLHPLVPEAVVRLDETLAEPPIQVEGPFGEA